MAKPFASPSLLHERMRFVIFWMNIYLVVVFL